MEKLKYAIHFCKSIDTDEYARVAADPTEATGSEDNSDFESVSHFLIFRTPILKKILLTPFLDCLKIELYNDKT